MVAVLRETLVPKEPMPDVWEAPSADGEPLGAASIEVDGADLGQAMTPRVHVGAW
jgi:hypothetical protein